MSCTDVHVLNVGAGACTVVKSPSGHLSMIDVNDGQDQRSYESERSARSLTDPIDWCREVYGSSLFRFILSHPDADHMAGLRRILLGGELSATNFWDLPHTRRRRESDYSNNDAAWQDWLAYEGVRQGWDIDGVGWPKRLSPMRGDSRDYWREDGFEVLSPTPELVRAADDKDVYNDASYAIRVRHTTSTVLIASDVEEQGWNDMIDAGLNLRANVLVASHHGRKSGFSEEAMDEIRPEAVIVSTAKLEAKDDGITDYKRLCNNVFSTRLDGDVHVQMDDSGDLALSDAFGDRLATFCDR